MDLIIFSEEDRAIVREASEKLEVDYPYLAGRFSRTGWSCGGRV